MTSSNRDSPPPGIRLQKILAQAGYGSRRKCELLIDAQRVSVNGDTVTEQGRRVDPARDVIRVDGQRIAPPARTDVLMLNKPPQVITAMSDERGRRCVGDLLYDYAPEARGYFHVGRLDRDTTGLLLLTNDGDLAQQLAHPSNSVDKTYVATVAGPIKPGALRRLRDGVRIDERVVDVSKLQVREGPLGAAMVELTIHEGRKHIVRRLLDEVGYPVQSLTRTRFGPVTLGRLAIGGFRRLPGPEVARLCDAVGA